MLDRLIFSLDELDDEDPLLELSELETLVDELLDADENRSELGELELDGLDELELRLLVLEREIDDFEDDDESDVSELRLVRLDRVLDDGEELLLVDSSEDRLDVLERDWELVNPTDDWELDELDELFELELELDTDVLDAEDGLLLELDDGEDELLADWLVVLSDENETLIELWLVELEDEDEMLLLWLDSELVLEALRSVDDDPLDELLLDDEGVLLELVAGLDELLELELVEELDELNDDDRLERELRLELRLDVLERENEELDTSPILLLEDDGELEDADTELLELLLAELLELASKDELLDFELEDDGVLEELLLEPDTLELVELVAGLELLFVDEDEDEFVDELLDELVAGLEDEALTELLLDDELDPLLLELLDELDVFGLDELELLVLLELVAGLELLDELLLFCTIELPEDGELEELVRGLDEDALLLELDSDELDELLRNSKSEELLL